MINDSISLLNNLYDEVYSIREITNGFNTPSFHEGYICYGQKLGQVNGHVAEQKNALIKCRNIRNEILNLIKELNYICSDVEDLSRGLINSFETVYNCDMFLKGSMYQAKFIEKSNQWFCNDAKEEWKEDYEKCLKLFNEITFGLTTHNFRILHMGDGSKAYFSFTVHGVPGDFEVSFPLNSNKYYVKEHWLDSSSLPMQMRLTWRRHWTIPVFDYSFDDFGTYDISELSQKLLKFVSEEKWKDFYNTKSYMKEITDPKTFETSKIEVEYDEHTKEYLEKILAEEIEACSKEGKKSH